MSFGKKFVLYDCRLFMLRTKLSKLISFLTFSASSSVRKIVFWVSRSSVTRNRCLRIRSVGIPLAPEIAMRLSPCRMTLILLVNKALSCCCETLLSIRNRLVRSRIPAWISSLDEMPVLLYAVYP